MDIDKLFNTSLKKLVVYEPGEQPGEEGWIKLNTNENPFPPVQEILEDIKKGINQKIRLYPDPTAKELRRNISSRLLSEIDTLRTPNSIFVGNGSDEILDIIMKLFINPEDTVVFLYPTYGMYKTLATLYNTEIKEIKLNDDFTLPDSVFSVDGKIFFINSPNNPNGKSFENSSILKICNNFPGVVVVDEAYADFSEYTSLPLLKKVKNLIVIRSFSKSFSLASLRLGYCVADPLIIKMMNNVKLPYNTSYIAQIAALSCINHKDKIIEQNRQIIAEKKRIIEALKKYQGINVLPSDANFIFVKFEDKSKTLRFLWELKDKKILVRHFNRPGLYEYLRITIGKKEQNDIFLNNFENIAKKHLLLHELM